MNKGLKKQEYVSSWGIAKGVETLRARVDYNMERDASTLFSEWTLADTGNNGSGWLGNITDMDGMGAFFSTDEEIKWVRDNGVFIKSKSCPKCLINLVIKLNT